MKQRRQLSLDDAFKADPEPFAFCGERFLALAGVSTDTIARLSSSRDLSLIGLEWLQSLPLCIARDLLDQLAVQAREAADEESRPMVH